MFQGIQGNMNASTSASNNEASFFDSFDMENPKSLSNPIINMPDNHKGYSEADKERCPVMSGKIKAPVQQPEEDEEEYDSDSSEEEENENQMPAGHEDYSEADKEKCPVMSGKIKVPQAGEQGDGQQKKKKKKKIQSGCPFMPSENKKPPALAHLEPSFEIPYISTLRHLFSFRGILSKGKSNPDSKSNFESYPIFLKHTLFHNEEKFEKIRKLEVAHRFFVYDKFREQGNKKYNRNKSEEALSLYEHALSCFKWLEIKKDEKKENDEESKEEDPLASLKPMNRALASILSDDNVELHDGEELKDSNEVDMRMSMLINIYLALACAYLKLNHYSAAILAIEEGLKLNPANSQLYFRRSQARVYNKSATLEDLLKAKEDIEKAIEVKHYEKLFQQEPGILKIMNVANAGEIYVEHAHYVEKIIKEKKEDIKTNIKLLFARVKELEFIEEAMLKDGRIPYETDNEHAVDIKDEDNMEVDIIREMITKYFKIIEFYLETEKKDQVSIARKEVQNVLDAYNKMKMYMALDFKNYENDPLQKEILKEIDLDMNKPKTQKRLEKLRTAKVKEIFENGHFNLEVFQYAVKDYFKRKEEEENKKKEQAKEFEDEEKPSRAKWLRNLFGVEFMVQMLVLGLLFALFWYWNKNGSLFGTSALGSVGKRK